jgi:glucose-6-phosphate dehydrogenase assembly protein OpcA|tara:strand:+ start:355 stop:690 length:336 start_codon:yes stop_codon:yes gene_type:complete
VADALKVLGQSDPAATTVTTLYTVPDKTMTTVSSIVAANRTGSAITFRLSVHVEGASADDKQYLYYDKSVAANDSLKIVIGITLNQSDVVKVYTSAVDMSFNMFGCETTND